MEILNVMKARRSVRKFKDLTIPDEVLIEMLEAAKGDVCDYKTMVIVK